MLPWPKERWRERNTCILKLIFYYKVSVNRNTHLSHNSVWIPATGRFYECQFYNALLIRASQCYKANWCYSTLLLFSLQFLVCHYEPDSWAFLQDHYVFPQKYSYCVCCTHIHKRQKTKIPVWHTSARISSDVCALTSSPLTHFLSFPSNPLQWRWIYISTHSPYR